MRAVVQGFVALTVLGVLMLGARGDDEEAVPLAKVPTKVLDTVKEKYPGADLRSAVKGIEDREVYYTIVLKHKDDEYEVSLTPGGKITEVARAIDPKDLPQAVSEALAKKYPQAAIKEASEVKEPGEKEKLTYLVELTTAARKRLEVTFDPRGEVVKEKEVKEAR